MAVNLNALAQSLPANNYKLDGGLGGAVSGMQIADYLDNRERGTRSDDLEYEAKQNELMNALADNPQKELARQLALTKGGAEQDLFKTGLPQQAAKMKIEDEIKTIQMKEGPRALAKLEEQSNYWEALAESHSRGTLEQNRELFVKQGAALGLPPINFNDPNLGATLAKYKQRAADTKEVLGRLRVQHDQQNWQGGENRENRASAERIAQSRNTGGVKLSSNPDNNVINQMMAKSEITDDDVRRLSVAYDNKLKAGADGAALEPMRKSFETQWTITKNKKDRDPEMKLYDSAQAYSTAKMTEWRAQKVAEQIVSQMSGKPLIVNGKVVGEIGESSQNMIADLVTKQSTGGKNEQTKGSGSQSSGPSAAPAAKSEGASGGTQAFLKDPIIAELAKRAKTADPKKLWDLINSSNNPNKGILIEKYKALFGASNNTDTKPISQAAPAQAQAAVAQGLAQVLDQTRPVPPGIRGDEGQVVSDQERQLRGY